eukprot:9975812-Ditylum_brightwellii.AAC.1
MRPAEAHVFTDRCSSARLPQVEMRTNTSNEPRMNVRTYVCCTYQRTHFEMCKTPPSSIPYAKSGLENTP